MATQTQQLTRPDYSRLYGLNNDPVTGNAIIRVPRTVKVGIGQLAGKDIHAGISPRTKKWFVQIGENVTDLETKEQARSFYRKSRPTAPDKNFPSKLMYFTFSKVSPSGDLEPDWDAIEKHGPTPTELDIVFTSDEPFQAAYEMWAKSGIQCRGNGIDAERICTMATTEEEKALAEVARKNGSNFFPIYAERNDEGKPILGAHPGCWLCDCKYSKPLIRMRGNKQYETKQCGVHGRLSFQLLNDLRIGGKASFDTTGIKSTSQIFSSLEELRQITGGRVRNIPLRMLLRPFKTNHGGQPGKAYAVSIEFRAESVAGMRTKLLKFAEEFGGAFGQAPQIAAPAAALPAPALKQIEAPPVTDPEPEYSEVDTHIMNAEFTDGGVDDAPVGDDDLGDPSDVTMRPQPETATISIDSLTPSQDPNRGHDAAAPQAPAPEPPVTEPPELTKLREQQKALQSQPAGQQGQAPAPQAQGQAPKPAGRGRKDPLF